MIRIVVVEIDRRPEQSRRESEQQAVARCLEAFGVDEPVAHRDNGAPYIASRPDTCVSISHSRNLAAVAIGTKDDGKFGIDIEDAGREELVRVTPRIMHPDELHPTQQRAMGYAKIWTAKESVFKAIGRNGVDFANQIRLEGSGPDKAVFVPDGIVLALGYADIGHNNILCVASEHNIFELKTL